MTMPSEFEQAFRDRLLTNDLLLFVEDREIASAIVGDIASDTVKKEALGVTSHLHQVIDSCSHYYSAVEGNKDLYELVLNDPEVTAAMQQAHNKLAALGISVPTMK
ncbi:hypothetical protein BTA51_20005 [Hahella sp. CCB-MM4]|uniref:hypothetical protein n=1 Tax=Hahella sp. (strain CCB-MM4) TaxID=1926491 RepID=UPI000B9BB99D|nr:hypothetical protein [Hahella sp. CCB-MM4]OZG71569.1 hypothetical protein BTA51_20005 [Hahella sp. CCB-MM4]